MVNDLSENHKNDYISFKKKVNEYYETLNHYRLQDRAFSQTGHLGFGQWVLLFIGWPVFMIGFLLNVLPIWAGRKLARKVVTNSVFYTSVLVVSAYLSYLLIHIPILITIGLIFGIWVAIIALIMTPIAGYFALYYYRIWNKGKDRLRFLRARKKNPAVIGELNRHRNLILEKIKKFRIQPSQVGPDLAENSFKQTKYNAAD